MIVTAIQKGGMIYVYTDASSAAKTINGYLVSFTGDAISYIPSKNTQTVIVLDGKLRRIRSFCAPKRITSGIGW